MCVINLCIIIIINKSLDKVSRKVFKNYNFIDFEVNYIRQKSRDYTLQNVTLHQRHLKAAWKTLEALQLEKLNGKLNNPGL